jgi:microcin C transport system permease protein
METMFGRVVHDPVTVRRWRRFRSHRRAFWSLCILLSLYCVSLLSELVANNVPLYVRNRGRSFFPVLFRYSQDDFLGDGVVTPPDYKRMAESPGFRAAGGRMIFPLIPYGPHEVLDPQRVARERSVGLSVAAEGRIGNLNVDADLVVRRSQSAGWFFGVADDAVEGRRVTDAVGHTEGLSEAVVSRLRNEDSAEVVTRAFNKHTGGAVELSAAAFARRAAAPGTVRISLREVMDSGAWTVRLSDSGQPLGKVPERWERLGARERSLLAELSAQAVSGGVAETRLAIGGASHLVKAVREEVRWPYRPVKGHILGIDSAGRDVLARLLYGLRISLSFGLLLVAASMTLGIALGTVQGYYGGVVDIVGQRITEIWHAIPLLYVMMLLGAVLGRSFALLLVTYILFNWIGISYYLRAEALRLRRLPFVDAARCLGLSDAKIMVRHILPNALTPVVTFFPFSLVGAIGLLAALDYLGFGLPALTPSWGGMLHEAQQYRWAWWMILYPSLALFVVMMLGVFIGEGVRDAYDPRPRSRLE